MFMTRLCDCLPIGRIQSTLVLIAAGALLVCAHINPTLAAENPITAPAADTDEEVHLPDNPDTARIDRIVDSLSESEVRRLLAAEWKQSALPETKVSSEHEAGGIVGVVRVFRDLVNRFQERIEFLRSGGKSEPIAIAGLFSLLGEGIDKDRSITPVVLSVGLVFAGAFGVQCLFWLYTASTRRRLATKQNIGWSAKIGALSLRALLDLTSIVVFVGATLIFFYVFLDRSIGQRVFTAAYLAAFVISQAAYLVSRFILAPHTPTLRLLPLSDAAAEYLHHWIMAFVVVTIFGLITCDMYHLYGASGVNYFIAVTLVGSLITIMLVIMVLYKRKAVAAALLQDLPEDSLRSQLAIHWHHYAIAAIVLLWVSATLNRFLGFEPGKPTLTLLLVSLYFLLDWLLRQGLEAVFCIADKPDAVADSVVTETMKFATSKFVGRGDDSFVPPSDIEVDEIIRDSAQTDGKSQRKILGGRIDYSRVKSIVQTSLRAALAALVLLWILRLWGFQSPVGTAVVRAAFEIIIVMLICYVTWEVASAAIQRRLHQEGADDEEEEMEEGGAGGSRIVTLLVLLRKFMLALLIVMSSLIILSSLGINIGPLIAGAGVVGLAIGFGAQTLVKDIIAGVFFLIDDAFRVGDYVESGGTKGVVEQISLRSLRLRHPRGMVNIIPFGDISTVTNFSRDYIITKLDFRVRYDADVEKIRKIIKKKVYKKILADPELGPKLLSKIKSQGVREMDDSAMIMRVKFKTIPGEQFVIRKEVYRLMQETFREEGIEFAHRNVTVYLPPDVKTTLEKTESSTAQKIIEAGAAAGAATIQEDERKKNFDKSNA